MLRGRSGGRRASESGRHPPTSLLKQAAVSIFGIAYRLMGFKLRRHLGRLPAVKRVHQRLTRSLLCTPADGTGLLRASVHGFEMYVDAREVRAGLFLRDNRRALTAVFESLISPGDTVVEVGAHVGYFTLVAAKRCGEHGKVVAFEPDPHNYSILLKNVQANHLNYVDAVQAAVADQTGEFTLHLAGSSFMHSLGEVASDPKAEKVRVKCVTLDDFTAKFPIEPSVIKIDIEGAEPRAFAGMRSLLARLPRVNMIVEFLPHYLGAEGARAFLSTLFQSGFRVAIIDDRRYQVATGSFDQLLARAWDDVAQGHVTNLLCQRGGNSDLSADPLVGMRGHRTLAHPLPKVVQL